MSEGYEGLKTAKVIQTLGLGNAVGMNGALYTSEIADAVADFQAQHGLNATGTVDLTTWLAMGFSKDDWYTLGAYVSPLRIDNTSSRTACIEAMISRAYDYLGDNYIIGASGAPGLGIAKVDGRMNDGTFFIAVDNDVAALAFFVIHMFEFRGGPDICGFIFITR